MAVGDFGKAVAQEIKKRPALDGNGKLGSTVLPVGTGAGQVKPGDWKPTAADVSDSGATGRSLMRAANATAARGAIGAVATVNGVGPDAAGDVVVSGSGGGAAALIGRDLDIWDPITVPIQGAGAPAAFLSQVDSILLPLGATKTSLGVSSDGTTPIWTYTVGNGPIPAVLIAGIHGREGLGQALRWVESFAGHPSMAPLRSTYTVTYVALFNPYNYGTGGKVDDTDHNRNYPHFWDQYVDAPDRKRGTAPFSLIESQYLKTLLDTVKPALVVDTHAMSSSTGITYQPASSWSGSNRIPILTAAEHTERIIAKQGLTIGFESGEFAGQALPLSSNWAGWYCKHRLGVRNATSVMIEAGIGIGGGSHNDVTRLSAWSYCTMLTQVFAQVAVSQIEKPTPLSLVGYNSTGSDTVAIGSGGRMLTTSWEKVNMGTTLPVMVAAPQINFPMPFPGFVEVTATGMVKSAGAAQAGIPDTVEAKVEIDGVAANENALVRLTMPETAGKWASFSVGWQQLVGTDEPDAATLHNAALSMRTVFAGGTAVNHIIRGCRLSVRLVPLSPENYPPRFNPFGA